MVGVCASVLFSILALCGCASEKLQAPANAQIQAKAPAETENILARRRYRRPPEGTECHDVSISAQFSHRSKWR